MDGVSLSNRVICRLEVKDAKVRKTRQFEGLRDVGSLNEVSEHVSKTGSYEILLNFYTTTLYNRPLEVQSLRLLRGFVNLPLIYCGGLSTLEEAQRVVENGADRICLNSALFAKPSLLEKMISNFGAQSVLVHVDVREVEGSYRLFSRGCRDLMEPRVKEWLEFLSSFPNVEIVVNDIAAQGMVRGFSQSLAQLCCDSIASERLIFSGGISTWDGATRTQNQFSVAAVASSDLFYRETRSGESD